VTAAPLVEVRGLIAGYGSIRVVHGLDLVLRPGEVVALLGPNGAGKTTTVLTVSGDLPALGGEVFLDGTRTRSPLDHRARRGLGLVTEQRAVFMSLTVAQNLRVSRGDRDSALELFPQLKARLNVRAGLLSGGEQQMLALAMALSRRPRVLLVDELSLGLAPFVVARLLSAIREVASAGVGVLLVEQQLRRVIQNVDRFYLLRQGQLAIAGTAREFQSRFEELEAAYF
jgi:branched-chain amino acid transport system ATP-binding protein